MAAQAPYPAYIVHCRPDKRSASGIAGWRHKRLIRPTKPQNVMPHPPEQTCRTDGFQDNTARRRPVADA
ncbi:hypothetical protein E7703_05440 [Citrobacter portucalensis]|nr:hypothetical protein E7703_05440 [Citrobacter portucalensis]